MGATSPATIKFSGVQTTAGGSFTLLHGAGPSVAQITSYMQDTPPAVVGVLTIVDRDTGATIRLSDCLLDSASRAVGEDNSVTLTILDRRWRWRYPVVSGRYNLRRADGTIDATTEKTPQELARLLLERITEPLVDVSAVPNDTRPAVEWDYENAAIALESLLSSLGCTIVLGADDIVRIYRLGYGPGYSVDFAPSAGGETSNPPETPQQIKVYGEPDEFELDFELEAIAREPDGSFVPIDEVSYKPAGGWGTIALEGFPGIADPKLVELAASSVFHDYRVKWPPQAIEKLAEGYVASDGEELTIERLSQIEFLDRRAALAIVTSADETAPLPPLVYGKYYTGKDTADGGSIPEADDVVPYGDGTTDYDKSVACPFNFSFDAASGIAAFSQPTYRLTKRGGVDAYDMQPAELRLRIAFRLRYAASGEYVRTIAEKNTGDYRFAEAEYVRAEGLTRTLRPQYAGSFDFTDFVDNLDAYAEEAQYVADGATAGYVDKKAAEKIYEAVLPISPDGVITSVAWTIGSGAPTTKIAENYEARGVLLPREERAKRRNRKQAIEALKQLQSIVGRLQTAKRVS